MVAFTYNEPTVFAEYALDIAAAARPRGLRSVMVSCGFMNERPLADLCRALDAVKIDLKGFSEDFYRTVSGAALAPVLRSIAQVRKAGVHLEIVNLVVPTLNDADASLTRLVDWVMSDLGADVPVHFTRFHPDYQLRNLPPTPIATLERARDDGDGARPALRVRRQRARASGQSHVLPEVPGARHHAAGLLRARVVVEERAVRRVRLRQSPASGRETSGGDSHATEHGRPERGHPRDRPDVPTVPRELDRRPPRPSGRRPSPGSSTRPTRPRCAPRSTASCATRVPARVAGPVAIVVPHAGYIYSGQIAADAYRQAAAVPVDTVVILGTNHTSGTFRRVSVYDGEGYRTPLGVAQRGPRSSRRRS